MGPQPPPQALRFSHGRGERETRVTGDEPQGTMEKGTDTFPPSFARTSKERRLGTRRVGALLTHYGYNDATNNHNSALQYISEENGRQTTYEKVLELFTSLGRFKEWAGTRKAGLIKYKWITWRERTDEV